MTEADQLLSDKIRSLHARMAQLCLEEGKGLDTMRMLQIYAGMSVELMLEYEKPGAMLQQFLCRLQRDLKIKSFGPHCQRAEHLPPVYILDREIEFGRAFIREVVMDDFDEIHFSLHVLNDLLRHDISGWQDRHICKQDSFQIFHALAHIAMALEIGAQDLCDLIIDEKVAEEDWSLADCLYGMCSYTGQLTGFDFTRHDINVKNTEPQNAVTLIDQMIFILSQEATRLGIEARSDWYVSLAANDQPIQFNARMAAELDHLCTPLFELIEIYHPLHRAALMAKAAGRMVAVAAGGEIPEIEPALARTMTMTALSESYRAQQNLKRSVS